MSTVSGRNRLLVVGVMMAIGGLIGVSSCTSDEPAAEKSPTPTAEPTDTDTPRVPPTPPDEPAMSKEHARLLAKARAEGQLPVLVSLRLDSTPAPDRARRQAYAEAIKDMYDELERFDFEKGHAFQTQPMFAARVDEAGLRYLIGSDDVENISEDSLDHPE